MTVNARREETAAKQKKGALNPGARCTSELPLSDTELEAMFDERDTPEKGRLRIQSIRENLPGRATATSRFAGKLRFASRKMGFALEAEAFSTEFVALVEWEHDPNTLEIYPQPAERLTITYRAASGRMVTTQITPDAFRVTASEFVFTECKTDAKLNQLSRDVPERYVKRDGVWRSPPAEAAAAELGCRFELRSSADDNYTLFNNLELLRDFLSGSLPEVPAEAKALLAQRFEQQPYVSAFDLIHIEPRISADHLYTLLVSAEVYFPIQALPLAEQERALFFRSEVEWKAHELFVSADRPDRRRPQLRDDIRPGDGFTWSGVAHTVINAGSDGIHACADGTDEALIKLSYRQLEKLLTTDIVLHRVGTPRDRSEADAIFSRASKEDRQEATWRYEILFGKPSKGNKLITRQWRIKCVWRRDYKQAEERLGNGYLGLLANRHGNRAPKAAPATKALALTVIQDDWETIRSKKRSASHGKYRVLAKEQGLDTISYQMFCRLIQQRAGHGQSVARIGEKAAYDLEPQYMELVPTTPRHGLHSWHIGHIDHTPLPLTFLLGDYTDIADTLWLTILTGAFDRKVRAYYLSFDEPSYRSCLMVVRDCVRRHGRFFMRVVSDGGSDFQSAYWETLLALLGADKRERLKGKPRAGCVCERIFLTTQTQFVTNLLGSREIVEKHFRAISPEVMPETHAVWVIDSFDVAFESYLETIYHKAHHSGLDMSPDEADALSLRSHGLRAFKRFTYDDQFIAQTCPEVHKGDALVQPTGIKIKSRWFDAPVLHQPGILKTRVPARYDPWNLGLAHVSVNNRWHQVHSKHYATFSKLTERAIRFATEALRLIASKRGQKAVVNAENLARFMMTNEGQEALARQLRNDAQVAAHRDKIQGPAQPTSPVRAAIPSGSNVVSFPVPTKSAAPGLRRERKPVGKL